ncbi:hypothetical protein [Acinetobacter variabilis]|nr:hypothetical protein [Acinetobacter variabilis]
MPSEIMKYFKYAHLPAALKGISHAVAVVADLMDTHLPDGAEKAAGLRKLLEAKDCFVRSAVDMPHTVKIGQLSDGYHSFDELYAHRMNLFAVICRQNQAHAWKSKLHHDGSMHEGYFIVGVDTPAGQFTYHYPIVNWGLFQVRELDKAPEWDNHTADDVVRLHSLPALCFFGIDWASSDHQVDTSVFKQKIALQSNQNNSIAMNEATFKEQYQCAAALDQYAPLQSRSTGERDE